MKNCIKKFQVLLFFSSRSSTYLINKKNRKGGTIQLQYASFCAPFHDSNK